MAVYVTSSPTFVRDKVKGWSTRMIFSQTFGETLTIGDFNYFTIVSSGNCKGSGVLPAGYWSDGRILRIKGTFLYSGDNDFLNMSSSIEDNLGNRITAYQDDNNDHVFAEGGIQNNVPVNFEINIIHSYEFNFTVEGHYQYEYQSYNSGGNNINVVHVPINPVAGNTVDITTTTTLGLKISPNTVNMVYVTVEELG